MLPPPFIAGAKGLSMRPFWSVMIPAYNPRADYLQQTLRSVLQQDPGPKNMQIEVIDDCSTGNIASEVTRRVSADRVTFFAESQNRGLANTWNKCIERARGHWVHILHQDDIVFPGFYERLNHGIVSNPHIGMAFSRFAIIDANGHWMGLGPLESSTPTVLENWLEQIATGYHLECPAVVVNRTTYEQLGGFRPELSSVLDVEMWVRIAAHTPVYYDPQILAGFRRHEGNTSAFQARMGVNMTDMAKAIEIWKDYLPADSRSELERKSRCYWADVSLVLAQKFFSEDDLVACASQLDAARALWNHGRRRSRRLQLKAKLALRLTLGERAISALRELRKRIQPA